MYLEKVKQILLEEKDSDIPDPIKSYKIGKICQSLINEIIQRLRQDLITIETTNPGKLERENYKLSQSTKYKIVDPSINQEIGELKNKIKSLEKSAIDNGKVEKIISYRISPFVNKPDNHVMLEEDTNKGDSFKDFFI